MTLKPAEIEHLASLSRLELSESEKEKFPEEISSILAYVERLQEVKGYELDEGLKSPLSVLRKDEVLVYDEAGELIKAAPNSENGLIKAKAVFEK